MIASRCLLSLLVATALATSRAETPPTPSVTLLGTALTQAKPDLLRWSLTVSTKADEPAAAAEKHAQQVAAVLRFVRDRNVRPDELQTSHLQLSESREFQKSSWVKDGYVATTQVAFTLRNLADYRDTWLGVSRLTGVTINNVAWDVSNRIDVQNTTRIEALHLAKSKAEQMAAALNSRIAEAITIEEVPLEDPWLNRNIASNGMSPVAKPDGTSDDGLAPGAVGIKVRVRVAFRLIGN